MATPIPTNEAAFTLGELADVTGGALRGDPSTRVRGVRVDSREVEPAEVGALFVALVGVSHDAHRFVAGLGGVAGAFVVSDASALPADAPALVVEDTRAALGAIAAHHRRRWGGPAIAITGSAGKTTTKDLVAAGLRGAGLEVGATAGNLNNDVGLPMTLLALSDAQRVAVLEIGTNARGEIAKLTALAAPDVAVVTLVAAAHTEGIGDEEDVFVEKTSIFGGGAARVVYADDERLARVDDAIRYGRAPDVDVALVDWRLDAERTTARLALRGRVVEASLRLVGEMAALNAAGALATALALEARCGVALDLDAFVAGMEALAPVAGRMRPHEGRGGLLVLDDAYNANPGSVALALRTAATLAARRGGRVVSVLGDMKELGALSRAKHAEVRALAESHGPALFVGPEMAALGDALDDADQVLPALDALALAPADVLLVKGSRSMGLDRVVAALTAEPQVAEEGAR